MRLDLGSQFFVHKVWISAIYIEKGKGESWKLKQLRQEIWSLMLAGEIKEAGHSATTIIHIIDSEGGVTALNGVIQRNCFKYSYW
jgi:hypothetical protein